MESSSANRALPFHIDLNEIPLSSPREADDDEVVLLDPPPPPPPRAAAVVRNVGPAVARGSENVTLLCSICERRRRDGCKDWTCLGCLIRQHSRGNAGDGGGRGGGESSDVGLLGLDINAPPPREVENEGFVLDLNEDATVGRRYGERNVGKVQTAFDSSISGCTFISSSTYSKFASMENGYDIRKASNVTTYIARSGFEDTKRQRLLSDTNLKKRDPGSMFEKRSSIGHSDPPKDLNRTACELYLQGLREYISERKGTLGVGWSVEFKFCHKRCKTFGVFHGPDGSTFESMASVASHLGLQSGVHTIEMENGGNRFSLVHKESNNMLRRKDTSGPMQTRSCKQSSNAPGRSFLESGSFLQNIQDGFPVQFEDFLLISTGHLDSRPSYHSNNQIWPVGYRSSWHDKLSGSIFVCDVTDGGDYGPKFRVQRYPCSMQSSIASSTVLSRPHSSSSSEYDKMEKDDSTIFGLLDDDNISIQMMLGDCSPPTLDNDYDTYTGQNEDEDYSSFLASVGNKTFDVIGQGDSLGEFLVEGSSLSSVWEMVSQTLLHASHEAYKQKGAIQFCCSHDICELDVKQLDTLGALSKFSCLAAPSNFPRAVHSEGEFNSTCEMLVKWFEQDRFGLDADFVQEILEQLPGILNCSGYKPLSERKQKSTLRTVQNGFLQPKRKSHMQDDRESYEFFRISKRLRKLEEESEVRGPCPSGKPFMSKLPSYLIGDALQVWDFSLRFSEVLGLEDPFSFWELEDELLSPWIDGLNLCVNQESDIVDAGDTTVYGGGVKSSQGNVTCNQDSRCTGVVLAKTHSFLLNVLVKDLLMKVAVYVDPNFDVGESKPRRGRKKDADNLATLKKAKLDMFPVNEVTWPEIARRYILAVLSMEGNLDSTETACRESGKIFHCLRGDGGILCGSLMGVAALEADAVLLAEAKRKIYGSLKMGSDVISIDEKDSDAACTNDSEVPEWAQVLEPVRKLPTNVGARIRKCINEALDRNPPEWARKILEHSISKEVYKGNASGPTKRAVISVLADLNNENMQLKPEKKEKVKSVSSLSDIIMKQCRVVLRQAIAADEDRVFCNLLGRTVLTPNDNDDEGRLGYPAMVSRPLDFRTIDLRLAAGSYGGSHEAFVDDVREVWNNICTAYGDQPDLISLAGTLSQKFEELYEQEVLSLVQKTVECKDKKCLNSEGENERDDFISRVNESSLPKAPWDEGICKVCGMDKDDDNVLLCDSCDSEYHTYCLDPPLVRIPEGNWYCPSCVAKKSLSRSATYITQNVGQYRKKRYQKEFSHKLLEALSELAKAMELKEYWELTLQERIFLMKFLCDEALNSAIIRDHIDQCASLSADLQQKLRSLNSELKLLKVREEFYAADLAKVKNNVGHGGDSGSNVFTFTSGVVSDGKLNGQVPESGAQSVSGCFRQLDNAGQINELMDSSKQSRSFTSNDNLEETCATSVDQQKSTNTVNVLQYQRAVKDKCQPVSCLQNEVVQGSVDFQPESPESSSNSLPSTAHVLPDHSSTGSLSNCDVSFSQAFNRQLASLKGEIRSLQDSITLKESELYKVSIRKEFLGRDSEGRPYWILGRSGSCLQIVANAGESAQKRLSPNFYHSGMDNSRQFGVLDWYASGDNVGIPNFCQWATYQSDEEVKELLEWFRDNDTRERELKDSILQWVSYKSKHSTFTDGLIHKKKELSTSDSDSSKGRKVSDSDFLVTKAMTVLSKKFGSCKEMDGTEVCKNPGLAVKVPCQDGIYRCSCLEPLWISRPHCYSCHQTFSNAEELAQHASDKCKSNSKLHESSQITENSSKRKKVKRSETCQEKPLGSNGINQASKSRKQGNILAFRNEKQSSESAAFVEHQDQPECPFKFEEIKRKFIVQSSLKEEIKKIGLIGSNGVPSFIPCRFSYLDYPVAMFSTTEDEVATETTTVVETCQQQSDTGSSIPGKIHIFDNLPSTENGIFGDELELGRGRSTLLNEENQSSSVKVKSQALGINKSFTVRESSVRPLVGRDFEILRRLKINLLDMDAALPEEALRASRSHSDRRCSWRAFVKSAATIYEMIQATIILEDTIKTEYLRNDWWYWSSPSAAAKISTLSALALRLYALDSAILYEKHLAHEEATEEASKPECKSEKAAPHNSKSDSPQTQKQLDSEPAESSKAKTRASKRRKDSGG